MAGNFSGRARIENEIVDLSVLISTGLKGINGVLGVTERGPIDRTIVVGSWNEYKKHFGGELTDSDFPTYCRRALEAGSKLRVGRVVHYSTITDPTTAVGTAATGDGATSTATIKAANIGAWGNGLKATITAAANGAANQFDIVVELEGSPDLRQVFRNINATLTLADISRFNKEMNLVQIADTEAGLVLAAEVITFTGGAADRAAVVDADFIGDSVAQNGIHLFDNSNDFVKIAIPEKAIPEIDIALAAYVGNRRDCIAVLRTPIGLNGLTAIDYREGTGLYSHAPINSWLCIMIFGDIEITDTLTGGRRTISAIGDVLGAMSRRDNKSYEWFSFAGAKRGLISNVINVGYNLASPARATEFDQVDAKGLNAVVADPNYGVVIWGNNTLSKENTLLKHANVAELLIFITRALAPLVRSELFEPNDVETWKAIYRKVRPFLALVKQKRGIWDFVYQGDQQADTIDDAVVNTPENVDNGEYWFLLWLKPKTALKYIGIKTIVTNSGINFEEVEGQPVY